MRKRRRTCRPTASGAPSPPESLRSPNRRQTGATVSSPSRCSRRRLLQVDRCPQPNSPAPRRDDCARCGHYPHYPNHFSVAVRLIYRIAKLGSRPAGCPANAGTNSTTGAPRALGARHATRVAGNAAARPCLRRRTRLTPSAGLPTRPLRLAKSIRRLGEGRGADHPEPDQARPVRAFMLNAF